ncbi:MAG TPA: biotin--[acetyl-CoA-carboxylase] ligase [Hyphomicrobium sp.]|nr:biotin--[acetyl-CoA-carboxylase] ligase [Hyphomicrobium sp.]
MVPSQHRIVHLAETGSTNADAMRLAVSGEPLPLWVTADRQTAGRGRSGRLWTSLPGNLQASLAFTSLAPLNRAGELSLVAGLALVETVCALSPLAAKGGIRLKWPNDLLIGPAKAGGILVETTTARGEPGFLAVIGFGLNVASSPDDIGRTATSLAAEGIGTDVARVVAVLADTCADWIARWDDGRGFDAIRHSWMAKAGAIGEAITVNTASGPVAGSYQGLAESGALLAEIDGRIRTITYGDVALIAPTNKGMAQ